MFHFIIATHHDLAKGMKDTLDFLTANSYSIKTICAFVEEKESLDQQIVECLIDVKVNDHVFVFTDMISGSVTQRFYPYLSEKFHLITGVNLPLVLSIIVQVQEGYTRAWIESMIAEARNQLVYVNALSVKESEEDE